MAYCIYDGEALSGEHRTCPTCAKAFQLEGYDLIRAISQDDWGTEYLGFEPRYHRLVAIKKINKDLCPPQAQWGEFKKKTFVQNKLKHPSIIRVYDYIYHHGHFYVIMEYVEGTTGATVLQKMGPVSASRAIPLCIQVAKALEYAHTQGIYHGLLDATLMRVSKAETVKITGFDYLRVQMFFQGQQSPEPLRDIALLGKLLYGFLTGNPISKPNSPSEPMTSGFPHIPAELANLTQEMMNPKASGLHSIAEAHQKLEDI